MLDTDPEALAVSDWSPSRLRRIRQSSGVEKSAGSAARRARDQRIVPVELDFTEPTSMRAAAGPLTEGRGKAERVRLRRENTLLKMERQLVSRRAASFATEA